VLLRHPKGIWAPERAHFLVSVLVLSESQYPDLNANSQITGGGFLRKRNKVYYSADEEEDRESHPLKALSSPF
jgi:hypothetical protein